MADWGRNVTTHCAALGCTEQQPHAHEQNQESIREPEIHRCYDCGHEWRHGQSGAHSCTPRLRATVDSLRAALAEEKVVVRDLLHGTEQLKAALAKAEEERDENHMHAIAADERAEAAEAKLEKATEALEYYAGTAGDQLSRDSGAFARFALAAIREVGPASPSPRCGGRGAFCNEDNCDRHLCPGCDDCREARRERVRERLRDLPDPTPVVRRAKP